jgi:hypothetical protein
MPGVMSWEEMNWLFPDFEETGLIYHGTMVENLPSIFRKGLIPGYHPLPDDRHQTIYEALYRHRPAEIPDWVDPRHCLFGYLNKRRFDTIERVRDGVVSQAVLGLQAEPWIGDHTWVGMTAFSDWLYCPQEAGYDDTVERAVYYRTVVEPVCAMAYWRMSLPFRENLRIRHDHLLRTQGYCELLICVEKIPSECLSLQALRVEGTNGRREILRGACREVFQQAEVCLRQGKIPSTAFRAISEYASSGSG